MRPSMIVSDKVRFRASCQARMQTVVAASATPVAGRFAALCRVPSTAPWAAGDAAAVACSRNWTSRMSSWFEFWPPLPTDASTLKKTGRAGFWVVTRRKAFSFAAPRATLRRDLRLNCDGDFVRRRAGSGRGGAFRRSTARSYDHDGHVIPVLGARSGCSNMSCHKLPHISGTTTTNYKKCPATAHRHRLNHLSASGAARTIENRLWAPQIRS